MSHQFMVVLAAAASLAAADLPYAGKWKINLAKSDFAVGVSEKYTAVYDRQ